MPYTVNVAQEVAFGGVGSSYGTRTAVAAAINTSVVLPLGWHVVETDANTTVRFTPDAGVTFITLVPVSSANTVWSDGFTTEIRGGAIAGTAHRSQLLGV